MMPRLESVSSKPTLRGPSMISSDVRLMEDRPESERLLLLLLPPAVEVPPPPPLPLPLPLSAPTPRSILLSARMAARWRREKSGPMGSTLAATMPMFCSRMARAEEKKVSKV